MTGNAGLPSDAQRKTQADQVFAKSPVTRGGPGTCITDDIDLKFVYRDLERAIKEIRLWWDVCSLENYLKCKRIPRGLRIRKFPSFDVAEFEQAWNGVLTDEPHTADFRERQK